MQKAAVGGQQALPVQRELPLHAATGKSALSPALPALPSSPLFRVTRYLEPVEKNAHRLLKPF